MARKLTEHIATTVMGYLLLLDAAREPRYLESLKWFLE